MVEEDDSCGVTPEHEVLAPFTLGIASKRVVAWKVTGINGMHTLTNKEIDRWVREMV